MDKRNHRLKFLQHLQFNLLKVVVAVCEENDLTYYLSGGSLLGAVRHKGFIPWDDDIDIDMPRKDYDQLLKILPSKLPQYMELATYKATSDYHLLSSQVWNKKVNVEFIQNDPPMVKPCWIDIFPLDGAPKEGFGRRLWKMKLRFFESMWGFSRIEEATDSHLGRSHVRQFAISAGKQLHINRFLDPNKWSSRWEKALKKTDSRVTGYLFSGAGAYKFNSIYNIKHTYGKGAKYEYEGSLQNGPANANSYLRKMYGDYMAPPPKDQRNWHGTRFISESQFLCGYFPISAESSLPEILRGLEQAKNQCDYVMAGVEKGVSDHTISQVSKLADEVIDSVEFQNMAAASVPFEVIFLTNTTNLEYSDAAKSEYKRAGVSTVNVTD